MPQSSDRRPRKCVDEITRPDCHQPTRFQALALLGDVVYAVRLPGGIIKIGHSNHLGQRMHNLGHQESLELLALQPGTRDDEQDIHDRLADHRHHGREWYYPTPAVLQVVNEMRQRLGLDALAA